MLTQTSTGLLQAEPLGTPSNSISPLGAVTLTSRWLQQSMQPSAVLTADKDALSPRLVKADPRASLDAGRQALSLLGRARAAPAHTASPAGLATVSELLTQSGSAR